LGEKYFSEMEEYKDCFIEVSDKWTMKEVRELTDGDEKVYFDYFHKKVDTMFLRDEDGKEFTNPHDITTEDLENFNVSLVGFFGSILSLHIRRRKSLGGLNVRALSLTDVSETQAKKK
jgi:hypothetical protein